MRAVISGVLRKRKLKVEQLTAVDLATFRHLICGLHPSEIKGMSAHSLRSGIHLTALLFHSSFLTVDRGLATLHSGRIVTFQGGLGFAILSPLKLQHGCAVPAGDLAALHRPTDGGTHKPFVQA